LDSTAVDWSGLNELGRMEGMRCGALRCKEIKRDELNSEAASASFKKDPNYELKKGFVRSYRANAITLRWSIS
jgi:hypothetical protein